MRQLRTNTACRITVGPFLDPTDGVTPVTSLTVTNDHLTLMVDDSNVPTLVLDTTATASGGNNDMVHVTGDDAGFFDLELTAANLNYLGRAMLAITDAAHHCPVFHEFMIIPANVYDSLVLGTANLKVDTDTIKTQTVTCSAGVTVSPFVGSTGAAINGTNANTLSGHDPGATLGTSTLTQSQVSGGAYALNSASFSFNAGLDLTSTQKTSVTTAASSSTPSVTVSDKTGFSLANGSFVTATFGTCDLTATMKTSVTTAASSATPSVTVSDKTGFSLANGSFVTATFGTCDLTATMKASVTTAASSSTPSVTVSDKTGFKLASDGVDAIVVEAGLNFRQSQSIIAAATAGVLGGAATTNIVIHGAGVVTTRIDSTVDADGNRSAITLTPPA